jgi:hypothetical protein
MDNLLNTEFNILYDIKYLLAVVVVYLTTLFQHLRLYSVDF